MNWEFAILIVVGIFGYFHLLNTAKRRYVLALVKLYLETRKQDTDGFPLKSEQFSKLCHFIVTPVPGMEFLASDIEGPVIKRVIVDEQGSLEVICQLIITDTENEFAETCKHFANQGWHKKIYV